MQASPELYNRGFLEVSTLPPQKRRGQKKRGEVDDFQNTTASGVYALGDNCGQVELTPMAIAAGRRLADRIFGGPAIARHEP